MTPNTEERNIKAYSGLKTAENLTQFLCTTLCPYSLCQLTPLPDSNFSSEILFSLRDEYKLLPLDRRKQTHFNISGKSALPISPYHESGYIINITWQNFRIPMPTLR